MATLVVIRYLDIRFLNGQTATDEKASMTDWVRYAVLLPVCATVLWVIAHAANYLFADGDRRKLETYCFRALP